MAQTCFKEERDWSRLVKGMYVLREREEYQNKGDITDNSTSNMQIQNLLIYFICNNNNNT